MGKRYDKLHDAAVGHCPPGMELKSLERSFWGSLSLITLCALGMGVRLLEYMAAVAANRKHFDLELAYAQDITMLPYSQFFSLTFWCAVLGVWMILCNVLFNYLYFRQESNSRYTMKRVKDSKEIHHRCWFVPVICALILIAFAIALYGIFCWIYFRFSPEGSIPAQTIAFFWRYVP